MTTKELVDTDVWTAQPPSLEALRSYTAQGGWVPGDLPWYAELPGKAYGYAVAIPLTALLYATSLLVQRPSRLIGAVLVLTLLYLFW